MDVENVLCMNAGVGNSSYARNSLLQELAISKVRPILEDTVKDLVGITFPTCIKVADLGCSSGPNTLFVTTEIINAIHEKCKQMNYEIPELQVFLNDLPWNDFNTIFKSLPEFYEKLKKEKGDKLRSSFVSGLPGSFYGRLFPNKSIHLVHSSNSVHWLSQVPNGVSNNKGNIFIASSSPPSVFKAYMEQFHADFSNFLSLRSEEIMSGGRMLLTIPGRRIMDPISYDFCKLDELLSKSLLDLVAQGLVKEADVNSFNLPVYFPFEDEVREIIRREGSFNIDSLETFEVNLDPSDDIDNHDWVFNKNSSGQNIANWTRASLEPLFAGHFGGAIIDSLFSRFADHVDKHECMEKTKQFYIVVSMTNK